jgi:hypothetical protein
VEDKATVRLDPDRLKSERHDADLGDEETNHNLIGREPGRPPAAGELLEQPTGGASPPAR